MPAVAVAAPSAGNAHNIFRQQSDNSQIQSLLDELTAYNPGLAGEDDAMLWDIPEFGGDMGEYTDGSGYTVEPSVIKGGYGRTLSSGGNKATLGLNDDPRTAPQIKGAPEQSDGKAAGPDDVGLCAVCGLVAAEISCHECRHNTCAFCDFQVHKAMPVCHTARVSLRPANGSEGKPEYSKVMAMTNKNGKRSATTPTLAVGRTFSAEFGRTTSAELMGGANLDDAILDFFKTDEFSDAVCKAGLDGGLPDANDGDMFGTTDFSGLPLMDYQKPAKMARTTTRVKSLDTKLPQKKLKVVKTERPVGHTRAAARVARVAEPVAPVTLVPRPRPAHFDFELDPTASKAAAFRCARKDAFERYQRKRELQKLNPAVRYKSRKKIADNRPRIKGRFVKTENLVRAISQ